MKPDGKAQTACIIAGEVSGDHHAAALVGAANRRLPGLSWFGIGGPELRAHGVETLYDVSDMAVMGISEVLRRYSFFKRTFNHIVRELETRRPDVLVLVDYPGFNLRLAKRAHDMGIRVVYYICPQVWAWRSGRIADIERCVNRLLTIFPFEAQYFNRDRLAVEYVGHPLIESLRRTPLTEGPELPWCSGPRIALLPGSRVHEIQRILPILVSACSLVAERHPEAGFVIASAGPGLTGEINSILDSRPDGGPEIRVIENAARRILSEADAAFVASGTATLETALLRCPMVIAYRVAPLTYRLARRLVKVDHIGMANIIAGRRLCPEFIQSDATAQNLACALLPLIGDSPERKAMLEGYEGIAEALGEGNAYERAAEAVVEELRSA